jgi:heme/copper-type cytochrome/quinol oxidase subunit 2
MGEEDKQFDESTEPTPSGGEVSGGLKALFIILAILFPIVGVILGIIWLTKKTKEEKALGKLTLIIAIIMIVLSCICWIAFFGLGIIGSLEDFGMVLPFILTA